jgi:hypothetical protein
MSQITILGRSVSDYIYNYASGLWAVTSYYNPMGYESRRTNYDIFIGLLRESGINVLTVECAFGDQPFDLPESIDVVRVHSKSLLWQKERILNLALPWLPPSCKYVAWLDCDLVFTNPNWARDTVRLLDEVPIVQVFETCNRLAKNHVQDVGDDKRKQSFALMVANDPSVLKTGRFGAHGHTGYGWAARREVLERHGLYEYAIAGGADHYMSHAIMGDHDSVCIWRSMCGLANQLRHFQDWAEPFFETVQGHVRAVPGEVLHLWHGDLANRRYNIRFMEFEQFGFDPYKDLCAVPGRPFEFSPDINKPDLIEWLRSYFEQRREDDVFIAA